MKRSINRKATVGTLATMTRVEIEDLIKELVAQQLREERWTKLGIPDMASHPFSPEILAVIVPPHVPSPRIDCFREEGNPILHIQKYESSLLGRTNDDNHYALLFPSTLGDALRWFYRLPKASVTSWGDLKEKFVGRYIVGCPPFESVGTPY